MDIELKYPWGKSPEDLLITGKISLKEYRHMKVKELNDKVL